jgi:hypothetical protein
LPLSSYGHSTLCLANVLGVTFAILSAGASMKHVRNPWLWFSAVQLIGGVLSAWGSQVDLGMYIFGLIFLLPGSTVAPYLSAHVGQYFYLLVPRFWDHFQTDATGLSDVLYLPLAILVNVLAFWAVKSVVKRRTTRHAPEV